MLLRQYEPILLEHGGARVQKQGDNITLKTTDRGTDPRYAVRRPLQPPGTNRHSSSGAIGTSKRGSNSARYIERRLKRDRGGCHFRHRVTFDTRLGYGIPQGMKKIFHFS